MKKRKNDIILALLLILLIIVIIFLIININEITGKVIEGNKIIIEKVSSTSNPKNAYFAIDGSNETIWNSGTNYAKLIIELKENYKIKGFRLRCDGTKGGNKGMIYFYNINGELVLTKEYTCDYFIGEIKNIFDDSISVKKIEIIGESTGNNVNIRDISFN